MSTLGDEVGTQGSLSLADGETITRVRFWADNQATDGIEFTTSTGAVHGPWGTFVEQEYDVQVCCCGKRKKTQKQLLDAVCWSLKMYNQFSE